MKKKKTKTKIETTITVTVAVKNKKKNGSVDFTSLSGRNHVNANYHNYGQYSTVTFFMK